MTQQSPHIPLSPLEKKLSLKIVNMLRNGKAGEAISFIESGKKDNAEEFKHQLIDYLYSRAIDLFAKKTHIQPLVSSSANDMKEKLCHDLPLNFRSIVQQSEDHQYQQAETIVGEKIVTDLLRASTVAQQEKILPYKGKIYLPTDKYSEEEQVHGIKKTAAFLSAVNGDASRARLQTLKRLIMESGLTECLIVANGPSLKQTNLAMLDGAFIIGLNSIFLHPYITPHVIICEDHLVGEDRAEELNNNSNSIKIIPGYLTYCLDPDDLTIVLNHRPRVSFPVDIDFSDNIDTITYTGGTVTYTALQVAIGLGFKRVNLVGCDASYKVENVKVENDYDTGILESLGDDPNHFNLNYFGKGFRWHDPNPLRMLQAYSVAERYASKKGINITNLTRGGLLEVFKREDYIGRIYANYPRVCVIDWVDINSIAATGEVKKALFRDWPKDKLLHVYSPKPNEIKVFRSTHGDIFNPDLNSLLPAWKAIIESNPSSFYWRPTHNRPILNLFASLLFLLEKKPIALHLMDYWTVKVDNSQLKIAYEKALEYSIKNAAHTFVISQRMKNRLCNKFHLQAQCVTVAHNYVHASPQLPLRTASSMGNNKCLIFYSGNLDPDQSLDPLLDICKAIEILNRDGQVSYELIIRTSSYHLNTSGKRFDKYDFVTFQPQTDDFDEYIQQTARVNLCIICYGFGAQSRDYLLDSMANKLPDLLMAKAKFFAYGDPEVGTLSYLNSIGFPFVESNRDPDAISRQLKDIALMTYEEYMARCQASFSLMNDEFSEMSQCHVFQHQLASTSSISKASEEMASNYSHLANLYSNILTLSNVDIPSGISNELSLMRFLAEHTDLIKSVYDRVRDHGITWSINTEKGGLAKSLDRLKYDRELKVNAISWMIASQRHCRFEDLWNKLFEAIVKDFSSTA